MDKCIVASNLIVITIMMTHARYIYLWWSGCQPKVKKHKVRSRGKILVLISIGWPKGWANWALDLAPWSGEPTHWGSGPRRATPYKGGGGHEEQYPVRVPLAPPPCPPIRGAASGGKLLLRRRSPLRFTKDLHGTAQRRRTPSAPTSSSSTTYTPR
jgi:hypothetical protein